MGSKVNNETCTFAARATFFGCAELIIHVCSRQLILFNDAHPLLYTFSFRLPQPPKIPNWWMFGVLGPYDMNMHIDSQFDNRRLIDHRMSSVCLLPLPLVSLSLPVTRLNIYGLYVLLFHPMDYFAFADDAFVFLRGNDKEVPRKKKGENTYHR